MRDASSVVIHPAVVVHGLDDARRALALGRPVTLLSAPGAASYAGCGWWRAMIAAAREAIPGTEVIDILDCLDQTGRAVEALRYGLQHLVLLPFAPAWDDAAARAEALGAVLLSARPPALDLARPGAVRHLPAWLERADA